MTRFAEELDVLGRPRAARPWAWVVLLAGAAAMMMAAQSYVAARSRHDHAAWLLQAAQDHLQTLQDGARAAQERAGRDADLPSARLERTALRHADEAAAALTHPWAQVLSALEDACDVDAGQALLGVRHSADAAQVTLDAAVRDDAAALALVDALSKRSDVFSDVRLQSLDTLAQPVGEMKLQVQIALTLADAQDPSGSAGAQDREGGVHTAAYDDAGDVRAPGAGR